MSGAGAGQAAAAPALRGLRRFAQARGIPAGAEFLLDYDVIEAFCVAGLPGARPSTQGTYRSALYRLADAGARRAGAAGDAVCGGQAAAPVLAGRAGGAGCHRGCPA